MAMEVEDDAFIADLSKQIALLIMDDDDEGEEFPVQPPPVHVQELSFHHVPQAMMPPPYMYEMGYRRESKGTGVFIPRSSAPRRKNRSGRSNSINNGSQRQLNNSGLALSWAANNDSLQSNYYKDSGSLKNRT